MRTVGFPTPAMLESILGLLFDLFFVCLGGWLGKRFWAPVLAAIVLGVIIVQFVPPGAATIATVITLVVLGLGGGVVWRVIGGRH